MKRKIIKIDQDKCTGCGDCIPNCPEGAIRIIDGKARLVSDLCCDGLGACLGHCPVGAISIEEREAQPYDERLVMEQIIPQGPNTIKAHLAHLSEHGQREYLAQALEVLRAKGIANPLAATGGHQHHQHGGGGCPGARAMTFAAARDAEQRNGDETGARPSQLSHWPIQLRLISPHAPQYQDADVLLAADCVAYALGDFHKDQLKGKALAIACPKLDEGQEEYVEKIRALIDEAKIKSLTVLIMQVPCCMGLLHLAREAAASAKRKVPIKAKVVGIQGKILREE